MRSPPVIALAAVVGAAAAQADILYDTTWITDQVAYDGAYGNASGGWGAWGHMNDARLADDLVIDPAEYPRGVVLTIVAQDSLAELGRPPAEGFVVRVFNDEGGSPAESPAVEVAVPLTDAALTDFDDPYFEKRGVRFEIDVSSFDIRLGPGVHWINIQPVDRTDAGDWFWQVWDGDTHIGNPTHWWEREFHRYWSPTDPGTAAMRIEGVAIPAPAAAFLLLPLCIPRRRRG